MKNRMPTSPRFPGLVRHDDGGQALVELALTIPLFFLLLFGVAELARVVYVLIEVTNAAEAAVRYGSQNSTTGADLPGITTAAQSDANDINLDVPSISTSCGCADGSNSGSACASFSCSPISTVKTLTVTTSKTFDPLIHLPGLPTSFILHGRAKQKVLY